MRRWLAALLVSAGIVAAAYPFAANYFRSLDHAKELGEYGSQASVFDNKEKLLAEARAYNDNNFAGYDMDDYYNLLKIPSTDVMARLDIPSVGIRLPVYHGDSPSVLFKGVGHMANSHLPIGGNGTHSVLSAHSGLPDQRMFDPLHNVEIGDVFSMTVLGDVYSYKIFKKEVIAPEDYSNNVLVEPGKDLLSLVTCTPYSVNTHRLIITGERVESVSDNDSQLNSVTVPLTELLKWAVPAGVALIVVIIVMGRKKKVEENVS